MNRATFATKMCVNRFNSFENSTFFDQWPSKCSILINKHPNESSLHLILKWLWNKRTTNKIGGVMCEYRVVNFGLRGFLFDGFLNHRWVFVHLFFSFFSCGIAYKWLYRGQEILSFCLKLVTRITFVKHTFYFAHYLMPCMFLQVLLSFILLVTIFIWNSFFSFETHTHTHTQRAAIEYKWKETKMRRKKAVEENDNYIIINDNLTDWLCVE